MKSINSSKHRFPAGVTSLLVVVGISLVFVVMVTGLTALSIRESRQAANTDLSNRALATAIAANNVGSEILNTYPTIQVPSCTDPSTVLNGPASLDFNTLVKPVETSSADNKVEVVCRTITSQGDAIEESLRQNELSQIYTYVPNINMPATVDLKWGSLSSNPLPAGYQPYAEYGDSTPSVLEVTVLSWTSTNLTIPKSPTDVANGGLTSKTKLLVPDSTLCNGTSADGYKCKVSLALTSPTEPLIGAGTNRVVVQLKPRYNNTGFKISFRNGAGGTFKVQSSRATIDTTAKVGSQYRRVKAYKNLFGESFVGDVVYSNESICKNLKVSPNLSLISENTCP